VTDTTPDIIEAKAIIEETQAKGLVVPAPDGGWAILAGIEYTIAQGISVLEIEAAFAEVYTTNSLDEMLARVNELTWYAKRGDEAIIEYRENGELTLTWKRKRKRKS
jgi:hypothetical protein